MNLTVRWVGAAVVAIVVGAAPGARAAEPAERDEAAIFGAAEGGEGARDEDAMFGGGGGDDAPDPRDAVFGPADEDARGFEGDGGGFAVEPDPLAIGGQLYLRLMSQTYARGGVQEQPLRMPSLLDLYLDARPEERVRAFFNGRLRYDPTLAPGTTDPFGEPLEAASVLIDQLWIKTDIARAVFLTVGQQRIKWGASRLWNPTDYVNATQRDPLAIFDERTGVPLIKVHIPIESLGWNAYALALMDSVASLEDVGAALRLELVFGQAELALSGVMGKGRKTSLGVDLSAGFGPFDVTLEVGLTDETDARVWRGGLDFAGGDLAHMTLPTAATRDAWVARGAVGLEYQFKPNDDDLMILGAEYFYNPLGYDDPGLAAWALLNGDAQAFYLGRHYAALFWLVPAPGSWDDVSFTLSNLANLSDRTFVSRLDLSATLHTRLRFEAYAMVHYGEPGGELRFEIDVPQIAGVIDRAFSVPPPLFTLGMNLRLSI